MNDKEQFRALGEYYLKKGNLRQAYIAFQQAKFYCQGEEEKVCIEAVLGELRHMGASVPKVAIIILSWNLKDYTVQCINSIRQTTPEESREIIVVDNGSTDGSVEWLAKQQDIILRCNNENHGFPKGCNEGIALASEDADIFLLNNDTVLPPNALFWLQMGLYENDKVGSTGSKSNYVSNFQSLEQTFTKPEEVLEYAVQANVWNENPYESKIYLVGFAHLIKRTVLDKIGLLDERFSPGNSEDVDICLRIREAGYENYLCHNSVILHFGSQSFQKLGGEFDKVVHRNIDKLNAKYGIEMQNYFYPQHELVTPVGCHEDASVRILQVGCGAGATLAWAKRKFKNAQIYGVEKNGKLVQIASSIQGIHVQTMDVEMIGMNGECLPFDEGYFNYCILGDELERVKNPLLFLREIQRCLNPQGEVIISMRNMKHWSVIVPLMVNDRFMYGNNKSDDRVLTVSEMKKLLKDSGFELADIYPVDLENYPEEYGPLIDLFKSLDQSENTVGYDAKNLVIVARKQLAVTELDENKICFITAVNDEEMYERCIAHINQLEVPAGMYTDVIAIREADCITEAYNAAMRESDAKYKIYLHQDLMITDERFIERVLRLFQDNPTIGICGVVGASEFPKSCIWWDGRMKGTFIDDHEAEGNFQEYRYEWDEEKPLDVDVLDGLILCTQYDVLWREDLLNKWHFYDASQCFEFRRQGYRAAVIPAEHSLVEHHCGVVSMDSYMEERQKFYDEYM